MMVRRVGWLLVGLVGGALDDEETLGSVAVIAVTMMAAMLYIRSLLREFISCHYPGMIFVQYTCRACKPVKGECYWS